MRYLIATVFLSAACGSPAVSTDATPPATSPTATAVPTGHGGAPASAAVSGLTFSAPAQWIEEPPASAMRVKQYLIPGEGGSHDASLIVYHFKDSAGSLDANIQRWVSQFEQPDGSDSADKLERTERTVAGMQVHEARLSGTFVAETRPGSGERVNEPGWRLIAAIIESDYGPYYVKLVGPAATVRAQAAAFTRFLDDVRVGP